MKKPYTPADTFHVEHRALQPALHQLAESIADERETLAYTKRFYSVQNFPLSASTNLILKEYS